jgi:acyl carrier protein
LEESVEETLKQIVLKITRKKDVKFTGGTRFADLDADSLDRVQIMVALEEKYDIELPDEEVRQLTDMGAFVKLIEKKIAKKKSDGKTTGAK